MGEMILGEDQRKSYLKSPTCCPICKNADIVGGNVTVDDDGCYQTISCNNCSAVWTDIYSLFEVELTEQPLPKEKWENA